MSKTSLYKYVYSCSHLKSIKQPSPNRIKGQAQLFYWKTFFYSNIFIFVFPVIKSQKKTQ